jgi:hypothetical protein
VAKIIGVTTGTLAQFILKRNTRHLCSEDQNKVFFLWSWHSTGATNINTQLKQVRAMKNRNVVTQEPIPEPDLVMNVSQLH